MANGKPQKEVAKVNLNASDIRVNINVNSPTEKQTLRLA